MAESAVSFLVGNLATLLKEEVKLLAGVREEVVYVKDELESMRAFLRVADAVEDDDEEIKAWVNQVRDVAYDTEDVIDEFLYRFEENRRHGFYGYLCKIARTIKNLKSRHPIASEMRRIKSRVIDISERRQRYRYRSNIMEQGSSSSTAANKPWYERRNDARLLQEAQLVGIDNPKNELVGLLLEDAAFSLKVVAVVGMGGLGKTTLVNRVYNDSKVKECFQHRAWITVSQSFDPCYLLGKIIQQLFDCIKQPIPQEGYSSERYDLTNILLDFLDEKRYLVVMDDVWDVNAWHDLKLAFPNKSLGSRIMLTTRSFELASATTKDIFEGNIHPLKSLSDDDSWNLFCTRTFQKKQCPPNLEEISQNILKRCMGLPLAIVTISGVLATKDTSKLNEWEMIGRSLGAGFDSNEKLKNMKKILSLSFNDLPFDLKYCFLSLSMFPEDLSFRRRYLTSVWIGEGFVQEIEGRSPEEVANTYFDELFDRSLIQLVEEDPDEDYSYFRVHDLLREIILSTSKAQNFATMVDEPNPRLPENFWHLSIRTTFGNLQGSVDFSKLRTLIFLHSADSNPRISMSAFFKGGLKLLKVLDCSGLPLDVFPECITKLYNLKYLNLTETKVASIPRSIGRLRNLEELSLRETFVEELPAEILKLHRLRHVIVYRSIDDQDMSSPPQYLQKLHMYGRLDQMLPHWVPKLSSLVILQLRWSKLQVDPLESLQALPNLVHLVFEKAYDGEALCFKAGGFQMLKIFGCYSLGRLRRVIVEEGAMPRLQRLWLEDCKLLEEVPPGFEFLSNLEEIDFINMGDQLVTRLRSRNQHPDFSRVKHVPSVYIGNRGPDGIIGDHIYEEGSKA